MKPFQLRIVLSLLSLLLLAGVLTPAFASHYGGADLTYQHIMGMQYRVVLKLYRDCSGVPAANNEPIRVINDVCSNPLTLQVNLPLSRRDTQDIFCTSYDPRYKCSGTVDPANPGRPSNFEILEYSGTITLPSRQRNWLITWSGAARPGLFNIGNGTSLNLATEARLNNLDFDNNTSPMFSNLDIPLPYVCVNQPYTYSFNAIEADGDSLSFALVNPMIACNEAGNFVNYVGDIYTDSTIIGGPRPVIFASGQYSAQFPIASFRTVYNQQTGRYEGRPYFSFNPRTGASTFIARIYKVPTQPADPANKHVMAVQITEWRRNTSGQMVRVGVIRRDILVTVVNCSTQPPLAPPAVLSPPIAHANGEVSLDSNSMVLRVQTCQTSSITVQLPARPNSTEKQRILVPGITSTGTLPFGPEVGTIRVLDNNTPRPSLELVFNPSASFSNQRYQFPVRCESDQCPVKQSRTYTVELGLVKDQLAAAVKPGTDASVVSSLISRKQLFQDTICQGDVVTLEAVISRPNVTRQQLNVRWLPAPGLLQANQSQAVVRPVGTQLYTFIAEQTARPGCADSGMAMVVVNPMPNPSIALVEDPATRERDMDLNHRHLLVNNISSIIPQQKTRWILSQLATDGSLTTLQSWENEQPERVFLPSVGKYRMELMVRVPSSQGNYCTSATTADYEVSPGIGLDFVSTVISPNNDGANDVLRFSNSPGLYSLMILDRYGKLVGNWEAYQNDWRAQDLPAGTYFYKARNLVTGKEFQSWLEVVK